MYTHIDQIADLQSHAAELTDDSGRT